MGVGELLAHAGIGRQGTVVHALDPVVAAQTGGDVEGVRPAVVHLAGGVGGHKSETVESRIRENGESPSGTHRRRHGGNVDKTIVATVAEIRSLKSYRGILGAHGLVESGPEGIWRIPGQGVVERHAGKIDVLGLGVVSPVLEADCAESIAGHARIDVVGAEEYGRGVGISAVVEVELGEAGRVGILTPQTAGQGDEHQVAHLAVLDGHVDLGRQEVRSRNLERIIAVHERLEEEESVRGGRNAAGVAVRTRNLDQRPGDRGTVATADDCSLDSAADALGERVQGEQQSERE